MASQFPALPRHPLRRQRRSGLLTPSTDMALDITPPTLGPLPPSQPQLRPKPRRPPPRRRRRDPLMPTTATEPDTALATDTDFPMADMGMASDLTTLPQSSPLPRRRRLPPRNKQTAIKRIKMDC